MTEQLNDLTKAKDEGRLIVLPCKVGDTVWASDATRIGEITDINVYISNMFDGVRFSFTTLDKNNGQHLILRHFSSEIGKTVFFAKEEAEAAIGEVQP